MKHVRAYQMPQNYKAHPPQDLPPIPLSRTLISKEIEPGSVREWYMMKIMKKMKTMNMKPMDGPSIGNIVFGFVCGV